MANMWLQRLKPRFCGSACGGAEAPPFRFLTRHAAGSYDAARAMMTVACWGARRSTLSPHTGGV